MFVFLEELVIPIMRPHRSLGVWQSATRRRATLGLGFLLHDVACLGGLRGLVEPREVRRLSPAHDKHPANEPQMKRGPQREDYGGGGDLNLMSILLEEVRRTISDEPDEAILDGDDEQHAEACVDVVVKARPVGHLGQDVSKDASRM